MGYRLSDFTIQTETLPRHHTLETRPNVFLHSRIRGLGARPRSRREKALKYGLMMVGWFGPTTLKPWAHTEAAPGGEKDGSGNQDQSVNLWFSFKRTAVFKYAEPSLE